MTNANSNTLVLKVLHGRGHNENQFLQIREELTSSAILFDCVTLRLVARGHLALMHRLCDSMINCVVFGGQTKLADGYVRSPRQWGRTICLFLV